ncbi:MAG: V-type ATP synthase subunit I, partial [Oscillospiraceae bacterium]|nr:V-type ATP synthase subunit I [Oscillospiraceae bacterium]
MAIVKMKKLRVTAMRSQKEELLKKLLILGCVEVSEPDGLLADPEVAALTVRETGELDVLRSEQASVARALETLGRYAPAKSKMFAEREDVAASDFLEEAEIGENIRLAVRIEEIDSQIRYTNAEETRLAAQIESLLPWEPLELPLDHEGTRTSAVLLGSVPPSTDFPALERALEDAAAEARAYKISVGRDQLCLCVIYLREKQDEVSDALREFSFSTSAPKNVQGTARENLEELRRRVSEQREQRAELTEEINAASPLRAGLVRCADVLTTKISRAEAGERFIATASTFTFTGWLPAPSEDELVKALGSFVCEWELMEPDPEEYPDVPVKLENNAVTSPLMMVTEMYSLPSYDGIDPNPLMAPFFIPFYGFMMADMGYGILMVVAALLIRRKKPRGGMKNFIDLLLMCGVTTIGGGFLTAG